jgi:hypothetical protein
MRGRLRIGLERERRDDGNAVGPGRDGLAGITGIDTGNAAQRKAPRPPAENLGDARQTGRADRRIGIVLRGGCEHTADADVIEEIERRRLGLRHRLDRKPDDCAGAEEPPGVLDRHVLLSHMDAVGAGGERDVDAIIDQQRDVERRERRLDGARELDHGARVAALVAKLDERRTTLCHQPGKLREIPPTGMFGIDQSVKAKIDGHCATPVPVTAQHGREEGESCTRNTRGRPAPTAGERLDNDSGKVGVSEGTAAAQASQAPSAGMIRIRNAPHNEIQGLALSNGHIFGHWQQRAISGSVKPAGACAMIDEAALYLQFRERRQDQDRRYWWPPARSGRRNATPRARGLRMTRRLYCGRAQQRQKAGAALRVQS